MHQLSVDELNLLIKLVEAHNLATDETLATARAVDDILLAQTAVKSNEAYVLLNKMVDIVNSIKEEVAVSVNDEAILAVEEEVLAVVKDVP